jgi:hypothetical protein
MKDLDRMIDAATRQMMSQEPSHALTNAVMARVHAAEDESGPRRFAWAIVGTSAAACTVIAILMLNSAPAPVVEHAARAVPAPTTTERTAPGAVQPDSTSANAGSTAASSEMRPSRVRPVTGADLPAPLAQSEFEVLAGSVPFESIAPLPIDLPGIAMTSTQVDEILIEPITIESLSASND